MNLSQFHQLRTAIQVNASPGKDADLALVEGNLRSVLMDSGLFVDVEVEHTDDVDQVEFRAASRHSDGGHYVTVHLVAQNARIPAQRRPSD
ncbi:MAG: hypothetical protein ACJ72A_15520 [Nocardioidaceae bacterium]